MQLIILIVTLKYEIVIVLEIPGMVVLADVNIVEEWTIGLGGGLHSMCALPVTNVIWLEDH